jgi:predicted transcriptional regulator
MTRATSYRTLDQLAKHQELHRQAVRRQNIASANRQLLKVIAAADGLAASSRGRDILESLLEHRMAYMRVRAAARVLAWAPEKAIPVLGRLLVDDLGAESSIDERIDIRSEATGFLYRHFGIRSFNRNDLIEPLRAYGIDLPHRREAEWT